MIRNTDLKIRVRGAIVPRRTIYPLFRKEKNYNKGVETIQLYTVNEVADLLKVSDRTIRRLCESGALPHIYVGSQIRFTGSDLKNYLISNKKGDFKNEQ